MLQQQPRAQVTASSPLTADAVAAPVRTTCRVCGSEALTDIVSLGNQALSNFLGEETASPTAPLELVLCDAGQGGCGLLQLRHTADQGLLYRNYWYRSGVNSTMRAALADVATSAERVAGLKPGDVVIDTGSNDNTLLKSYTVSGLNKVGFEPATNLLPYAQDDDISVINDFFAADLFFKRHPGQLARVITSIAMFYDLEDPNAFVADAARCLDPEGVWVIQMMYLPIMLAHNVFDNICHEHLEYYSLQSLEYLLRRHGLKVVDGETNDVNGGSFRAYVTHAKNAAVRHQPGAKARLNALREEEAKLDLHTLKPYQQFAQRVRLIKEQVGDFIRAEAASGKRVYVYGASTKGNTLLQYFDLDHSVIAAAAERNPDKWGKKTVATFIPIISEEQARREKPDYFLVLPWHFLPEFIQREAEYLRSGGKFIVPLPQFRVVGAEALAQANLPGQ